MLSRIRAQCAIIAGGGATSARVVSDSLCDREEMFVNLLSTVDRIRDVATCLGAFAKGTSDTSHAYYCTVQVVGTRHALEIFHRITRAPHHWSTLA